MDYINIGFSLQGELFKLSKEFCSCMVPFGYDEVLVFALCPVIQRTCKFLTSSRLHPLLIKEAEHKYAFTQNVTFSYLLCCIFSLDIVLS